MRGCEPLLKLQLTQSFCNSSRPPLLCTHRIDMTRSTWGRYDRTSPGPMAVTGDPGHQSPVLSSALQVPLEFPAWFCAPCLREVGFAVRIFTRSQEETRPVSEGSRWDLLGIKIISAPPTAMASSQESQSRECSIRQDPEGSSTSQDMNFTQIWHHVFLNDKLNNLLRFLLGKYQKKELITMEEMLHTVDHDYREHFLLIFRKLCVCIFPGFGMEMREVDPPGHTYVLVPILGLTYNGILDDDDQIIPKIDLLIFILSIIFIKGNRVSEEDLRKLLRNRKLLSEREHAIIGDPWKFITEDLVREEYLVYQQVPNSDPTRYEFLWGPRTHAETSKMKVLEHVAQLERASPRSYPHLYVEALREERDIVRVIEGQEA
ncbi:Melanoma-associated antigen 11 [Fukomys damarensis]|uniref:Melanoma-associated antigen 11 n=1 Tax=Fukomys damarensis TaxID=885580 RepID=A0A091E178_FUKDA|nr:Melanoma-associated antigen 11 [Fukomys damarensis]